MKGKPYVLALSHPMRESFSDLVSDLPHFAIDPLTQSQIQQSKHVWKKIPMFQSFEAFLDPASASQKSFFEKVQRTFGLLNVRRFRTNTNVTLANGGFLFTNKPYVIQIEKATQIFGYSARSFRSPIGRFMLRNRLKDKNLSCMVFMTETALIGFRNTFKDDKAISALAKEKSAWCYPPANNPRHASLERFQNIKTISLLFVSSSFLLKGGRELVRAFVRLAEKKRTVHLTLITHKGTIDPESLKLIRQCKQITLVEAGLDRKDLFIRYLNKAHCFVYPTYSDSFSMTVNEAIAAYLPIITSDFFSIPERVQHGKNGYCFKSPFANYSKGFAITEEHFGDQPKINRLIFDAAQAGKLDFVEEFLYTNLLRIANNPSELLRLAQGSKHMYETRTGDHLQRAKIDGLLRKAVERAL